MRVLVFAAYSGIGREVVRRLRSDGAALFLVGRNEERVCSLAEDLDCGCMVADVANFSQVEEAFFRAGEALGGVDGVVNCAGSLLLKPAHLVSSSEWESTLSSNLTSAFSVVRAAGKVLNAETSVVLFSSAATRIGLPNHEAIVAAKAGIEGLVRSAASTYARKGIRFNAVAPGLTETPLTSRITSVESSRKKSESMHALGRLGTPSDIASAVEWLLSPNNSWVTGQVLAVDGGLSSVRN